MFLRIVLKIFGDFDLAKKFHFLQNDSSLLRRITFKRNLIKMFHILV